MAQTQSLVETYLEAMATHRREIGGKIVADILNASQGKWTLSEMDKLQFQEWQGRQLLTSSDSDKGAPNDRIAKMLNQDDDNELSTINSKSLRRKSGN